MVALSRDSGVRHVVIWVRTQISAVEYGPIDPAAASNWAAPWRWYTDDWTAVQCGRRGSTKVAVVLAALAVTVVAAANVSNDKMVRTVTRVAALVVIAIAPGVKGGECGLFRRRSLSSSFPDAPGSLVGKLRPPLLLSSSATLIRSRNCLMAASYSARSGISPAAVAPFNR
uniref:Uncharacterized protein n=1 Tax=Plectus sambesii TaxID=2011161 RepID=A0A914V9I4_9BILA